MKPCSIVRRARRQLAREGGWVLVTAMILLAVMLSMGLATFAYVDGQQRQSGTERQKDTAFNLAEAAMNMTAFSLSNNWPGPGSASNPFPTCTQSSTDPRCPNPGTLQGLVVGPDATNASWQVNVYDNGQNAQGQSSGSWYSDSLTPGQPSYDCNGTPSGTGCNPDDKLWIRAQATINGNTRVLVEEIQMSLRGVNVAHNAVTAGSLHTTDNGNKILIDTQGSSLQPATVAVRCDRSTDPNCLQYRSGQISPDTTCDITSCPSAPTTAMSTTDTAALKAEAQANGTYFSTCPTNLPTSFAVAWIDSGNCSLSDNTTYNSATSPGLLVINNGTLTLGGNVVYYGVIYALNAQNSTSETLPVVATSGNAQVFGGILVDGGGSVEIGSSHVNLTFDDHAFSSIQAFGNATPLQNTFRQIPH